MRIFNSLKYNHAIYLKFGHIPLTSLTMLGLEEKAGICSSIKENLILNSRKFSAFVIAVLN